MPLEHDDLAARDPGALARMRALFADQAPTPRDAPVAVVHLRVAPDERAHVVDGTLQPTAPSRCAASPVPRPSPVDAHTLRLTLRGAAEVDLAIDPPTARITLALKRDGTPIVPRQVLLGEFALPLLAGADELRLDGERLTWIDAARIRRCRANAARSCCGAIRARLRR